MSYMIEAEYLARFGQMPGAYVADFIEATTGLRLEPGDRGPRGAIYNWRVLDQAGEVVHSTSQKQAAQAFIDGAFRALVR